MKTKFFFLFLAKINFISAISIIPKKCDCEDKYNFKTGNLSTVNIIPNHVYLFFKPKESNATTLSKTCHAIVLDKSWLLSVADCVKANDLKKNNILVGIPSNENKFVDFLDFVNKSNTYTIEEILIHPNYSDMREIENKIFFNFAILRLKVPFQKGFYLQKIKPACLYFNKYLDFLNGIEYFYKLDDISLNTTCYQSFKNINRKSLSYSSHEEYNFVSKYCFEEYIPCFSSEKLEYCLQGSGNPLYTKKKSKIFVVGLQISHNFLQIKSKFNSNCSRSYISYFSHFYYAFSWLEKYTKDVICKVVFDDEEDDDFTKTHIKIKKLQNIKESCQCENVELLNFIGNDSFFDEKKYTKRFNSPKKYFRHVVQIVKHNLNDNKSLFKFICTGVVINENFVLTTEECANETDLNYLYIYFGKKNIDALENIDSFFPSYSSKVLEQIFHPFHIPNIGMFYNDLQILRTHLPIRERSDLLSPACFANEKELEKQADDRLLIASFMLLGNFQDRVIDSYRKSNIEFIVSKYITDYYHQGVDQCDSLICVPTPIYADLGTEGTPLHRFTEYSMEVSGLMKKNVLPVFYKLHRFIPLTSNMRWIKSVVGQFDYCERQVLNRYFSKKICKCDYSLSNYFDSTPFMATLISYTDDSKEIEVFICKSIIMNEYWVLTTYTCFNGSDYKIKNTFVSLLERKLGRATNTDFSENDATDSIYSIEKIIFEKDLQLVLVKTKEKFILGKQTNKLAGCFYRKEKKINLQFSFLVIESFFQKVQTRYFEEFNHIIFDSLVCRENEGSPVSLIDYTESAIVGLFSITPLLKNQLNRNCIDSVKNPQNFISVQNGMDWINQVIGEKNYCHIKDNFFDHRTCKCKNQNVVSILTTTSIVGYYKYLCKGIIVNDLWILTTATCLFEKYSIHVFTSPLVNFNNTFRIDFRQKKYLKEINFVYKNPNFKKRKNDFGDFKNLEFNFALIRLKYPLGLSQDNSIEASCFTNKKYHKSFKGYYSKIRSLKNYQLFWNQFVYEHYTKLYSFNLNSEILVLSSNLTLCDSDQGEPIKVEKYLGTLTVGLLSNLDNTYLVSGNDSCFKSILNLGVYVDINNAWFKDNVEAYGICEFEKFNVFKIKNFCVCDLEGKFPEFSVGQRIFNGTKLKVKQTKYFQFMAFVGLLNAKNIKRNPNVTDYKFLSSAVLISKNYILTAKTVFYNLSEDDLSKQRLVVGFKKYFNFGRDLVVLNKNEVIFANQLSFFENSSLLLIKVIRKNFNFLHLTKAPCYSLFNYINFDEGKLFGFGYGKTNFYEIFDYDNKFSLKKKESRLNDFYSTLEFTTDFTEVLKRNPNADLSCEKKYICLTSYGTISEYDIGGPLLFFRNNTIELVGILAAENHQIPGPYEIFRFLRLSYHAEELKYLTSNQIECNLKDKLNKNVI